MYVSKEIERVCVCNFDHVKAKFYRTFNCIYAKSFAANSELTTIELLRSCCLSVLLYAIESLVPRDSDINSLYNCINTAVAKIFRVSFGNDVDFIRQMTGLISLSILVAKDVQDFLANCISRLCFKRYCHCFMIVCFNFTCVSIFVYSCAFLFI